MAKKFPSNTTTQQASEGRRPQLAKAAVLSFTHERSGPFFWKAHPYRWQVIGGKLLPQLSRVSLEPGINGVDKNGDWTIAKSKAMKEGWIWLEHDIVEGGYVREYDGRNGPFNLSIWERPRQVGNRPLVERDEEGYVSFLTFLVESGIVPRPDRAIVEAKVEICRAAIEDMENAERTPVKSLQRHKEELRTLLGILEEMDDEAPPLQVKPQFNPRGNEMDVRVDKSDKGKAPEATR